MFFPRKNGEKKWLIAKNVISNELGLGAQVCQAEPPLIFGIAIFKQQSAHARRVCI
jgi:hypothetical protein